MSASRSIKNALKMSLSLSLSTLFIASTARADFPRDYNDQIHYFKMDDSTGNKIGRSLYEIKDEELQVILKKAVNEINLLSPQELFKFTVKNKIFRQDGDLAALAKTFLVEQSVEKRNLDLIAKMNAEPLPVIKSHHKETRTNTITNQQVLQTAQSINYSPATDANPELKAKYDPEGNLGLCFLRAHYYVNAAAVRGLDENSIKKVYVVGTMMPLGLLPIGTWQFHVAGAVRGEGGEWKVLDNHLSDYEKKVSSVTDWYKYYDKWLDTVKKYEVVNAQGVTETVEAKALFLFFTEPNKLGASAYAYNKQAAYGVDLDNNGKLEGKEIFYNGVFMDVDKHLLLTQPGVCDSDRYNPMSSSNKRCSSEGAEIRQEKRDAALKYWKAEWDYSQCIRYSSQYDRVRCAK